MSVYRGLLAACDDSGDVKILDIDHKENIPRLYKTLDAEHTNVNFSFEISKNSKKEI
jgi:hypothetical protein